MSKSYLQKQIKKYDRLEIIFVSLIPIISFLLGRSLKSISIVSGVLIGLFLGALTAVLLFLGDWANDRGYSYFKGLKGEQYVEKILNKLPTNYRYFKSDKLPYADYLVVGDTGVFCLEIKNMNGKITYNAQNKQLLRNYSPFDSNYLKQTKGNSAVASQLVKEELNENVFINPVLVFTGRGVSLELQNKVDGVDIINSNELLHFLQTENGYKKFDKEQQEKIYNVLV